MILPSEDIENPINHRQKLEVSARKLNEFRLRTMDLESEANVGDLKVRVSECKNIGDIVSVMWSLKSVQQRLLSLTSSKLMEQILALGFKTDNPLSTFPPDVNDNLYTEIIDFGLQ